MTIQSLADVGQVRRWHLVRILDDPPEDPSVDREVHVSIRCSRRRLIDLLAKEEPEWLVEGKADRLDWWDEGHDGVEGRTMEHLLLGAVAERNLLAGPEATREVRRRRLAEDMVLLQFVRTGSAGIAVLEELAAAGGFPDLGPLVRDPYSAWLDFTGAARKQASRLYREALREARGRVRAGKR